eukprot:IDg21476t1
MRRAGGNLITVISDKCLKFYSTSRERRRPIEGGMQEKVAGGVVWRAPFRRNTVERKVRLDWAAFYDTSAAQSDFGAQHSIEDAKMRHHRTTVRKSGSTAHCALHTEARFHSDERSDRVAPSCKLHRFVRVCTPCDGNSCAIRAACARYRSKMVSMRGFRAYVPRLGVSKLFSSDVIPIENTVQSCSESFGVTWDDTAVHMRQHDTAYDMQNTFTGRGVMFDMRRPGMHRCTTKAKQEKVSWIYRRVF